MGVVNGIVAFIKAVPIIDKWFRNLAQAYYTLRVDQINDLKIGKQEQRDAQISAIQKAENDAEIIALSITLSSIGRHELPE